MSAERYTERPYLWCCPLFRLILEEDYLLKIPTQASEIRWPQTDCTYLGDKNIYLSCWCIRELFFRPGIRSTWFLKNQVNPFVGPWNFKSGPKKEIKTKNMCTMHHATRRQTTPKTAEDGWPNSTIGKSFVDADFDLASLFASASIAVAITERHRRERQGGRCGQFAAAWRSNRAAAAVTSEGMCFHISPFLALLHSTRWHRLARRHSHGIRSSLSWRSITTVPGICLLVI